MRRERWMWIRWRTAKYSERGRDSKERAVDGRRRRRSRCQWPTAVTPDGCRGCDGRGAAVQRCRGADPATHSACTSQFHAYISKPSRLPASLIVPNRAWKRAPVRYLGFFSDSCAYCRWRPLDGPLAVISVQPCVEEGQLFAALRGSSLSALRVS